VTKKWVTGTLSGRKTKPLNSREKEVLAMGRKKEKAKF